MHARPFARRLRRPRAARARAVTWYHHGRRWTDKFAHVVGVIHTNYLDYARREEHGQLKVAWLALFNRVVCRVHCHKARRAAPPPARPRAPAAPGARRLRRPGSARVCAGRAAAAWHAWLPRPIARHVRAARGAQVVKLSDAVQQLPRQTTQFVHGVPESFLEVGAARAAPMGGRRFGKGAYFIGKVSLGGCPACLPQGALRPSCRPLTRTCLALRGAPATHAGSC